MNEGVPHVLLISDYLGDPDPVIIFFPGVITQKDVLEVKSSYPGTFLPTLVEEVFPAALSPTLLRTVQVIKRMTVDAGGESPDCVAIQDKRISGIIARELRNRTRKHN